METTENNPTDPEAGQKKTQVGGSPTPTPLETILAWAETLILLTTLALIITSIWLDANGQPRGPSNTTQSEGPTTNTTKPEGPINPTTKSQEKDTRNHQPCVDITRLQRGIAPSGLWFTGKITPC